MYKNEEILKFDFNAFTSSIPVYMPYYIHNFKRESMKRI